MNPTSDNSADKQIRRTVIVLVLLAGCFYFGFIIATGMNG
jgi:hypothetical protein